MEKEKMKATAIIILNYNNYEDTINCIESVEKFNTALIKYIIVDNGSSRENCILYLDKYLNKKFNNNYIRINDNYTTDKLPYVTFLVSTTNDGYARGNNKGLKLANLDDDIENILILNNDVLFVQDIIPELEIQSTKLVNAAILSPILYKKNKRELDLNCARKNVSLKEILLELFFHYGLKLLRKKNPFTAHRYLLKDNIKNLPKILQIELPSGSCMFVKKDYFASIGFFDPNTFLYYEENILYKKIEKTQRYNYLLTDLKCIHLGAKSTSSSPGLFTIKCSYDSCRYYMKHYHDISYIEYLILTISLKFNYYALYIQKKLIK